VVLTFIKVGLVFFLVFFLVSVGLVFSQKPTSNTNPGLDFSRATSPDMNTYPLISFFARDNYALNYRQYNNDEGPLIILIHGSSAHGGLYAPLALALSEFGTVITPDLRGHGVHLPKGDVQYIGQLEDDLTDLIDATRRSMEQKVILVGHSSGGGLLVRYAGNPEKHPVDGVVLLAPYLGFNSPTTRTDSGGWAQPLVRRIIGLSMLNAINFKLLNHFTVITFGLPDHGNDLNMIDSYSYRMNTSYAPRYDFKKDMTSLPEFRILIGENDEALLANEYDALLNSFDNLGSVRVFDGLSHLDIIDSEEIVEDISMFIERIDR